MIQLYPGWRREGPGWRSDAGRVIKPEEAAQAAAELRELEEDGESDVEESNGASSSPAAARGAQHRVERPGQRATGRPGRLGAGRRDRGVHGGLLGVQLGRAQRPQPRAGQLCRPSSWRATVRRCTSSGPSASRSRMATASAMAAFLRLAGAATSRC